MYWSFRVMAMRPGLTLLLFMHSPCTHAPLEFPHDFHLSLGASVLKDLPDQLVRLSKQFYSHIDTVREGCCSVLLGDSPEEYDEAMATLNEMEEDIATSLYKIASKASNTLKAYPPAAVCGTNIAHVQAIDSDSVAAVLNYDQNSDDEATRPSLSRANEVEEVQAQPFPCQAGLAADLRRISRILMVIWRKPMS